MTVQALIVELAARGIALQAQGERLRYHPASALPPELIGHLEACKREILALLSDDPEPVAKPLGTHASREIARFLAVCKPHKDGRGWYDPAQARAIEALAQPMPEPIAAPEGLPGRQPDCYDVGGQAMTWTERAEHYRDRWRVDGYPPGIASRASDVIR